MLKNLRSFLVFQTAEFLKGKALMVTAIRDWEDYNTKQYLGTKVEVTVTADNTAYPPAKNGQQISNLYEKMWIKVPDKVSVPIGSLVAPVNAVGTIYGEYQNQLSIRADSITVLSAAGTAPTTPAPAPARPVAPVNSGKSLH
ncbi:MAG: hypothetical protein HDT15_11560 [Oscillibacter sp.]|nr:hypothetical protein [Oscillibacter sp.]